MTTAISSLRHAGSASVGSSRLLVTLPVAALGVLALAGCASIGEQVLPPRDMPIRTISEQVPDDKAISGTVEQRGTALVVNVQHMCRPYEQSVVARTTRTERVNNSPWIDWTAGIAGFAAVGAGAGVLVDASNVHANDPSAQNFNQVGPTNARLIGAGLVALGAVLLVIPTTDIIRANQANENTQQVTLPRKAIGDLARCANKPYGDAGVAVKLGLEGARGIGSTQTDGTLRVDLDQALPKDVPLRGEVEFSVLLTTTEGSDPEKIGTAQVKPLFLVREKRAWVALDRDACEQPTSMTSCQGIRHFLNDYPDGPHATRAAKLLADAEPQLRDVAEQEAWASAGFERCSLVKSKDADKIRGDCQDLSSYVKEYPNGKHTAEATKVLDKRRAEVVRLLGAKQRQQEAAERAAAAAEVAAERATAAAVMEAERREVAREQAEKRAEEAAVRAEGAQERAKCVGMCRMGCSSWSIRDHAGCLSGCITNRCE